MRQDVCSECGVSGTGSRYLLKDRVYCEPCVGKASREAMEKGESPHYIPLSQSRVCARCGASNELIDFTTLRGQGLCPACRQQLQNWPYPNWLKIGLAGVLLLLAVALVNGRKYFHAGRSLYIGERLVDEAHFEQALPYLQESLRIAPESDKAVLLTAKAALKVGRVDIANNAIQGHEGGHFEDPGEDFQEVKALWDRANKAFEKADKAAKLEDQDGHAAEAAKLMHEAATEYPESKGLAITADMFDEGTAFEDKDYDKFVSIAQKQWSSYPDSGTAAVLSSAFACKYAITEDPNYKKQSEDMLKEAERRGGQTPDDKKSFEEYAERIRYRLSSREIISKTEYNRRFRSAQAKSQ